MTEPGNPERDAHLRAALRHAPDAHDAPPPALSAALRAAARAAVQVQAPPLATPWWQRAWASLARPRPVWAGGAAALLVSVLTVQLWQGEPVPPAVTAKAPAAAMPAPAAPTVVRAADASAPTAAPDVPVAAPPATTASAGRPAAAAAPAMPQLAKQAPAPGPASVERRAPAIVVTPPPPAPPPAAMAMPPAVLAPAREVEAARPAPAAASPEQPADPAPEVAAQRSRSLADAAGSTAAARPLTAPAAPAEAVARPFAPPSVPPRARAEHAPLSASAVMALSEKLARLGGSTVALPPGSLANWVLAARQDIADPAWPLTPAQRRVLRRLDGAGAGWQLQSSRAQDAAAPGAELAWVDAQGHRSTLRLGDEGARWTGPDGRQWVLPLDTPTREALAREF